MPLKTLISEWDTNRAIRAGAWLITMAAGYAVYVIGISYSPPGFYVDESGLAYNAYLVSQTGAGEFGDKFPLYFKLYTGGFTQYSNPTQIYLLAALYSIVGPGIVISRMFAAACVFAACILLGLLAYRVSANRLVGVIVGLTALATPWLFQVGRLVLETFFYPMAVVALLWAIFCASRKHSWSWLNVLAIVVSLSLLTYSYTIGRLLAPLLAFGLVVLVTGRERLISVVKVWILYALSLIPLLVFNIQNPDVRTRFYLLSYIKPESSYIEIFQTFVRRFLQDLNPFTLLFTGDSNQRHHLPEALGSLYVVTFVLAVVGLVIIVLKHRNDGWWRYVLFGTAAALVPGALTVDPFHTLRMIAYPIFLITLTIPTLTWLFEKNPQTTHAVNDGPVGPPQTVAVAAVRPRHILAAIAVLLTLVEASYFHRQYYVHSPKRGYIFDAAYKPLYDEAVSQPERPIYLADGYWGPAYIHSFWYATLEDRPTSEFFHLPYGKRPLAGSVVLSTEKECTGCQLLRRNGDYILYRTTAP